MTSARENIAIRVGIFVFAGVFLSMVIIFLLGSDQKFFKRQYVLFSFFQDISGLRSGATIQLGGLNVGLVKNIGFGEDLNDKRIRVVLLIDRKFKERIRRDSLASISTQGLLGDKIISISPGTPAESILEGGEELPSIEKDSFLENLGSAAKATTEILEAVQEGPGLLHSLIYETPDKNISQDFALMADELQKSSKELRILLEKVNRGEGTIGALLSDPALYNDIRRLFARVERNKLLMHIIRGRVRDLEKESTE